MGGDFKVMLFCANKNIEPMSCVRGFTNLISATINPCYTFVRVVLSLFVCLCLYISKQTKYYLMVTILILHSTVKTLHSEIANYMFMVNILLVESLALKDKHE